MTTVADPRCPACGRPLRAGACLHCAMAGALGALEEACADPAKADTLRPETRAAFARSEGFATFAAPQWPGRFAHFEVRREVATGGMGTVYEAEDTRLARTVALKMIRAFPFSTAEEKARFTAEAGAAAVLDHPHIVPIYEVGEADGQPYFTMKLIEGGTLATRLKDGPLSAREAAELMGKVARAVHHAHQRGVLHRDLKPGNILLDATGAPYLTDFGLAKLADHDSGLTRTNAQLGTPQYMSPEQAAGRTREISTASDVWALGVMLFQMLSGRLPFAGESSADIMRQIVEEEAPPLHKEPGRPRPAVRSATGRGRPGSLDRDLSTIVARCLEKEPARRLPSAEFLAEELERWRRGEPIRSRQIATHERWWKWVRRHQAAAAAIVVTSAALLGGTGVSWWQAARAKQAQRIARQHETEARESAAEAQRQSADADQATKVILDTLSGLMNYGAPPTIQRDKLTRQVLDRVQTFEGDPLRKARMLSQVADTLPVDEAIPLRAQALALAQPLLNPDDRQLWECRFELARARVMASSRDAAALEDMRLCLEWSRAHLGPDHPRTARIHLDYGFHLYKSGQAERAVEQFSEGFRGIAIQAGVTPLRSQIFYRAFYARALCEIGRHEQALTLGRDNARAALAELATSPSYDAARALYEHAVLLRDNRLPEEALTAARQSFDATLGSAGPLDRAASAAIRLLESLLREKPDPEGMIALQRDLVREFDTRLGPAHAASCVRMKGYSRALIDAGRVEEADKLATDWLDRVRRREGALPESCEEILRAHIEALRTRQQSLRAEAALRELIGLVERLRPTDPQRWGDQSNLAEVLCNQRRHAEAVPLLEQSIAELEKAAPGAVRDRHLPLAKRRLLRAQKGEG